MPTASPSDRDAGEMATGCVTQDTTFSRRTGVELCSDANGEVPELSPPVGASRERKGVGRRFGESDSAAAKREGQAGRALIKVKVHFS